LVQVPDCTPVTVTEKLHVPEAPRVPLRKLMMFGAVVVRLPPQTDVGPLDATVMPGGSVSVKPMLVKPNAFVLPIENCSVDVDPSEIWFGVKLFDKVGAAATFKVAVAARLEPPSSEPTVTLFSFCPADVAFTLTLAVQLFPGVAIEPPLRVMLPAPATAVNEPPQLFEIFGELSTTMPLGNVSVKESSVKAPGSAAGSVITMLRVETPFTATPVGAKLLTTVGAVKTFRVAVAVPPGPLSFEEMTPVVLTCAPTAAAVTVTLNVQLLFGADDASVPPENAIVRVAAVVA